jgi:hypothetical protein
MAIQVHGLMPNGEWGIRNAFVDYNKQAFLVSKAGPIDGHHNYETLLDHANFVANEWRKSYPDGVQLRVVNTKDLPAKERRAFNKLGRAYE